MFISARFKSKLVPVVTITFLVWTAVPVSAQTWDGGGANDNWSTVNNWNPNALPLNNGTANISFSGTIHPSPFLDQGWSVRSLAFTGGAFQLGGSGRLTVGAGGISTLGTTNPQVINHAVTVGSIQVWNVGANSPLAVNGVLDGMGRLAKNGPGVLTFTQDSHLFSGPVSVNEGTLMLGNGGSAGMFMTPITVGSNASLVFNHSNVSNLYQGVLTGTGSLEKTGAGQLRLSENSPFSGPVRVRQGTLVIGSSAGPQGGIASPNIELDHNATINYDNSGDFTVNNAINGLGTLSTVARDGTMTITKNTSVGHIDVISGNLRFGDGVSDAGVWVGDSITLYQGTSLIFHRTNPNGFQGFPFLENLGNVIKRGPARQIIRGSYTGTTTIEEGTLDIRDGLSTAGHPITISSGGTLLTSGLVNRNVSGAGTVTAAGNLLLGNMSNTNGVNLAGSLNVGGNTVILLDSDTAQLGSATNLASGGKLISVNGARLGPAVPAPADPTQLLTATASAVIDGNFTNRGLVQGPTAAGQFLTFHGDVNGSGSYTGNIIFADDFSLGDSPAVVHMEHVRLENSSTLTMEIGGIHAGHGHDQLVVSQSALLGGQLQLIRFDGYTPAAGTSFLLLDNTSNAPLIGTFLGLPEGSEFVGDGQLWRISYTGGTGNDLTISAVPEPGVWALFCVVGLGTVGRWWWMRRPDSPTQFGILIVAALTGLTPGFASGQVITFQNGVNGYTGTEDALLVGDGVRDTFNWGNRFDFYAGPSPPSEIDRTLIRFDVSALSGQAIQINSVILRLTVEAVGLTTGSNTVTLHQVLAANGDWVEGTADGNLQAGSSTWAKKVQQTATEGIDWVGGPGLGTAGYGPTLASQTYTPTTSGLFELAITDSAIATALINDFLTGTNEGFLLKTSDESVATRKDIAFWSSENGVIGRNPALIVTFTSVPEPSSMLFLGAVGVGSLAWVCRLRTRRCSRLSPHENDNSGKKRSARSRGAL
jgi:autotransporter-associated beta strand protein